jgi:hypothetical protein
MMRRRVGSLIACVTMLLLPAASRAQSVFGIVRDSASRSPIPGAVVEVLDASSDVISRVITNERGQYRALFPPQWLVAQAGERDIIMVAIPTLLQAVSVWDQAQCPSRADRPHALALWEQARAALLATIVGREANPGFMTRLSYHRVVGERRPLVLSQVVRRDSALADRPFVAARSASAFIRDGFLSTDGDKRVFDAPDADVLLDDTFPLGYCFRLAPSDKGRPTHVGLAFEPLRRKNGRIDIDGTLWIDSVSRTLTDLTFRYMGLTSAEEKLGAGGRLTFRSMPNGMPVIDTWVLQLAAPRSARDTAWVEPKANRRAALTTEDLELYEIGGVLAGARWGDSTAWHAALGSVSGRLMLHGAAIPGTEVMLVGTNYRTRSDSDGRFRVGDLLPGRYVFGLPDSALNAVGYQLTHGQAFEVRSGATTIADMILPTDSSLIAAKCGVGRSSTAMVAAGRVLTRAGEPAQRASLEIFRVSSVTGDRLKKSGRTAEGMGLTGAAGTFFSVFDGERGAAGKFWLCDVAPSSHYVVEARMDGEKGLGSFVTSHAAKRRYTVTIVMDPPK